MFFNLIRPSIRTIPPLPERFAVHFSMRPVLGRHTSFVSMCPGRAICSAMHNKVVYPHDSAAGTLTGCSFVSFQAISPAIQHRESLSEAFSLVAAVKIPARQK